MTIDKNALFETTKALWPATLRISENSEATHEIYWSNEKAYSKYDDWQQLALWSFHQSLSALEKRASVEGQPLIYPYEVAFADFDLWMRSNLNGDDCWLEERVQYEGETSGPDRARV